MSNGTVVTDTGLKIAMRRTFMASPSLTEPSYFSVGTGTTTPNETDTAMTSLLQIAGANTKAIVGGYPTFDDTNHVATTRCLVDTTECNGNTITEFGLFNHDGTPLIFSHAVFTGVAKTSSVQIIFVEKDLVE